MSQRYLLKWAMSSGTAIREAQEKISRKMVAQLALMGHQTTKSGGQEFESLRARHNALYHMD
jgi:hypothetical protein